VRPFRADQLYRLRLAGLERELPDSLELEHRARHARHGIAQEEEFSFLALEFSIVADRDFERDLIAGPRLSSVDGCSTAPWTTAPGCTSGEFSSAFRSLKLFLPSAGTARGGSRIGIPLE
jgi:hypothetical protein